MTGRGVDLVIHLVGSTLPTSLVQQPEGHLVFIGNAGGESGELDLWLALQPNPSLHGGFIGTQLEKPDAHASVLQMLGDAAAARLDVLIDRTFELSQVRDAHA